jgi:hypothetical protein
VAANSLKRGSAGLNVTVNDDFVLSGKYFVMKDLAVLAGFGVGAKGGDAKGTDFGIGGGVRKYLSMEDFAPFVGGSAFYGSTLDGDQKDWNIMGEFGAEYFMHKQFSVEGSAGFGYRSSKTKTGGTTFEDTTFGTRRFGFSLNFYFM